MNCNCDICIGRGKVNGKDVCPFSEKSDVIPVHINKADGTKSTEEEIRALYDRLNEEYDRKQNKS
jgi:hypothetical protein